MDAIEKKLQELADLKKKLAKLEGMADRLKDLDAYKDQLDQLQVCWVTSSDVYSDTSCQGVIALRTSCEGYSREESLPLCPTTKC